MIIVKCSLWKSRLFSIDFRKGRRSWFCSLSIFCLTSISTIIPYCVVSLLCYLVFFLTSSQYNSMSWLCCHHFLYSNHFYYGMIILPFHLTTSHKYYVIVVLPSLLMSSHIVLCHGNVAPFMTSCHIMLCHGMMPYLLMSRHMSWLCCSPYESQVLLY